MHDLTEADKKLLTEWLGERWLTSQECIDSYASNRDFDSPDDFFALKNKLVELGKWFPFWAYAIEVYCDTTLINPVHNWVFVDWFINAERFPKLVVRYLKEKK